MYKIIIFILFSAISLNAAEITWVNAFPIYVYGDVTAIAKVYEFINNVVADPSVHIIIGIGVTMAIVISGWKVKDGDYNEIIKALFAPITLYALFFVPTVNVHITDLRVDKGLINYSVPDGGYRKVDNVPYMIAFIPASSSTLVSLFIDLIDNSWDATSVGSKFSTLGFQEMSHISQEALILGTFNNLDVNSSSDVYNMQQYVHQCLVIEALKVPSNHQKLIKPSKTFPEMYDPANFDGNISNVRVTFTDATGVTEVSGTCANLYTTYVSGVASSLESDFGDVLQGNFPNVDTSSATFNETWRENAGVQQTVVGNIRKAMITGAASRALAKDLSTDGIGVDGVAMATEIAIEKTIANLRTEGLAKYEWMARMLPNAVFIIMMLMLGIFPLMIIVMTFMGFNAFKGVANFFMGYIAMNFNLVSLALVSNIISYYTAQNAQNAIVSYAGMPFGSTQISEFMYQQADMAGLAGIIGAISVPFVTAAIFYGETKGLAAGISGVTGAFRGNVAADAKDTLVDRDAQQEIDKQMLDDAKNERDASAWLTNEGFPKPSNMSAVEAKNQMMKNLSSIGNANAASEIFHSGNAQNFISGSAKQSSQGFNKTAGFGANGVSMETAGSVSFEDGEVMGSMIQKTSDLRSESESYDTSKVGEGQAIGMFGKDMGSAALSDLDSSASATVANATNAVANQVGAGRGLLETGAFNSDGTLAGNAATEALIKGAALSSAQKASEQIGAGSTGDMQDFLDKGLMDGSRNANATNRASQIMKNGVDSNGNPLYDEDRAAQGQAMKEVAAHNKNMQTADAADFGRTGEVTGVADFISGAGAQDRIAANDAIGVGEKWQNMTEAERIADMAKVKENSARKTFGGIRSANAELHADGRDVDDAIKDDITGATEKGIGSATHADNLREKYGSSLKGENGKGMTLSETMSAIDMSKLDSQEGQAAGVVANKGINPDMYSDNADYSEQSKQQSTQAKLDAQDGIGGAVGIDVTEASIKAGTQKGNVEESSKILENAIKNGAAEGAKTLSDAAAKIAEVQTGMQMGSTAGLMKKFSDPEALKKTLEDNGYKDAAKELEGMSAGDMAAWVSSKQAGHMTGMHGLALRNDKGEMTSVGVSLGDDGARAMTVDSSFKKDNSKMNITGDGTNNVSGYNISPTGLLQEAMTTAEMDGHSAEMLSEIVKDTGVVMAADQFLTGGKGRKAAFGAAVSGWHKARGHEKGINADGKTVWATPEEMSKNGLVKGEDGSWKSSQYKSSDGVGPDLKKATTTNPTNNTTGVNTNANTGVDMENSSVKNSNTIIPKSEQAIKPSIAQQIEAQGKYEQTRASMIEHNAKVNALNNGGTPEMLARQKAQLNALEGAHNQFLGVDTKPNLQVPNEKGFFEKRMSALSSVWDGGGSWKTKIAMSAGAMALGSVSATASDLMDAVDPIAHASGTSLGDSSYGGDELKQMQAQFKSNSNGFTTPSWVKGVQPVSTVPQHVQTTFSTPSGFNTQQAISTSTGFSTNAAGQEIYGANKNDTLFRNDTSAESLRIQEDIALGTEFNQETSEGIQAAVERLMDADRNETKE